MNDNFNPQDWLTPKNGTIGTHETAAFTGVSTNNYYEERAFETVRSIIQESLDGEKHLALCKASYLLGGYYSGGVVQSAECALQFLKNAISQKSNVADLKAAFRTIEKSFQAGKRNAITLEQLQQNRANYFGKFNYNEFKNIDNQNIKREKSSEIIVPEFPVHIFPPLIQDFIKRANETVNFPVDYLAAAVLYTVSVAIGNSTKIQVRSTQIETAMLFTAIIGSAGVNKSHPVKFAIKPLVEREEMYINHYLSEKENFDVALETYSNTSQKDRKDKPKEPVPKQLLISDSTIESINEILVQNPRGIGLYRDELLAWLGDFNKYRSGGNDETFWLSTWNNTFTKTNRKTGQKLLFCKNPFVSVIGTIQNALLPELASGNKQLNGFLDRILFVVLDNLEKPKFCDDEIPDYLMENYKNVIYRILDIDFPIVDNKPQSQILQFSPEAKRQYIDWYDYNVDLTNNSPCEQMKSVFSKLDMYTPRFALILQMLDWACGNATNERVESKAIQGAIHLAKYFRANAIKIRTQLSGSKAESEIETVVKFLSKKNHSLRQIAETVGLSHTQINTILHKGVYTKNTV